MKVKIDNKDTSKWWMNIDPAKWASISQFLASKPPDWEGELIIRDKINWNVTQMRRFFEGPVVNFVRELYAERGEALGKGDIREALKAKFLGWTEDKFSLRRPISTTTLDFNGFKDFLNQINEWCMSEFQCGLPEPDNTELGDENGSGKAV